MGAHRQLLADAAPDAVYDPGVDVVVQEELTAAAPRNAANSPRSSPAPDPSRADLTLRNVSCPPDPIVLTAAVDIG
ncbi:hypothetical protein [Streptomyces sp. NBC_00280]|uniref:hypothetical protein n=1 Tax=Streptomyces sp. NBC_00280 TaxID=2975699 RepID=UPI00324AFA27